MNFAQIEDFFTFVLFLGGEIGSTNRKNAICTSGNTAYNGSTKSKKAICTSMKSAKFIGRTNEINRLKKVLAKKTASFVIIKGRRRIGKSRLIREFSKQFKRVINFRGIAPVDGVTSQMQIDEFMRQMETELSLPPTGLSYDDWSSAFWALSSQVQSGQILLVFDEISWMGSEDPLFLSKIKDAWDTYFKNNDKLVFIICGSASAWIEKNIMSNAGFVGRLTFSMTLQELSLAECREFWPKNISDLEILKILSVTGGVPKYLEEIDPSRTAEDNIKDLCFTQGGLLVDEYQQIFSDIFLRDSDYYTKILKVLQDTPKDLKTIQETMKLSSNGRLSEYLWELELAGFISRDYTWKIKTGEDSKLSCYRLKDNYLRFYIKHIEKNLNKIHRGLFAFSGLNTLSSWHSTLGLQFENLVLANRHLLHEHLEINPKEIINANPYFQHSTQKQSGCQVDYLIQTQFNTLYIVEMKFSKNPIGSDVISEVQKKIEAIGMKQFSYRPVLIHINGVTDNLIDEQYFSHIINFSALLSS